MLGKLPLFLLALLLTLSMACIARSLPQSQHQTKAPGTKEIIAMEVKLAFLDNKLHRSEKIDLLKQLVAINEASENYYDAINYALQLVNKFFIDDSRERAELLERIGHFNFKTGDYVNAITNLQMTLNLKSHEANDVKIAAITYQIALSYDALGVSSKALQSLELALARIEPSQDKELYANMLLEAGKLNIEKGMYDDASGMINQALELLISTGNKFNLGIPYYNLAYIAFLKKDYNKAMSLARTSLDMNRTVGNHAGSARCYLTMAKVMSARGEPLVASEYYTHSMTKAREAGDLTLLQKVNTLAAQNQEGLNNYKKASELYKSAQLLQDSLINVESAKKMAEMQARYNFASKQLEIESLKSDNKIKELTLNRNRSFLFAILVSVILVVLVMAYYFQRNKLLYIQRYNLVNQKLLRMQMNPHFIFNALSAIQSFVLDNDPKEASKYLSTFARLIRLVLENSRTEFVPIEREERLLKYYIELQQLRFKNKFDYNISFDPSINKFTMLIPTMISQPFVENSIEHGIQGIEEKGILNIFFKYTDEHILLVIEDNGVGMNHATKYNLKVPEHQSLSTIVTTQRLELLNKKIKSKYSLGFTDAGINGSKHPGTRVSIKMPFKIEDK